MRADIANETWTVLNGVVQIHNRTFVGPNNPDYPLGAEDLRAIASVPTLLAALIDIKHMTIGSPDPAAELKRIGDLARTVLETATPT